MADDDDPTIEKLQRQLDELNAELDEIVKASNDILAISKACEHMAQKLATKFNDPLADWWWLS